MELGVQNVDSMLSDMREISKLPYNSLSGVIIVLRMLYVCRVTITGNLDVTWGYLWAAGFSAVPAVFLKLVTTYFDTLLSV